MPVSGHQEKAGKYSNANFQLAEFISATSTLAGSKAPYRYQAGCRIALTTALDALLTV
jgi:hypothetical protein